jgi:hypothetical protein
VRILLEEDVPGPLKRDSAWHEVSTVPEIGWAGVRNCI